MMAINIVKQATSHVQNMYQTAKKTVKEQASNVSKVASNIIKAQNQGFVDTAKIWGKGINDAVQKNFGLPAVSANAGGGFIYNAVSKVGVQAAAKSTGAVALAKTGYDAVVNIGKGYYNYFTGSK